MSATPPTAPRGKVISLVYIERTGALEPLERTGLWGAGEPHETDPTAL
jgi:hypothetical protein